MKYYLSYSIGKMHEIVFEKNPTIKFSNSGRHGWEPFKFRLVSPCDIVKDKPLSFTVEGVQKDGCVVEKWEVSKVESYSEKDSNISVKFGYAIHNH
jgi:hypothetical protein